MRIEGYNLDEEKMNSPIKYDREFLIELANQPVPVFTVPEDFIGLAREPGSTSPTRSLVRFQYSISLLGLQMTNYNLLILLSESACRNDQSALQKG